MRAILALLLGLVAHAAAAQTALVTGNCNVTIQEREQTIGAGATVTNTYDVDCGGAREAEIRVQYVWLDALSASLVMGGVYSDNLRRIVGDRPRLLRLGAWEEMDLIVRRLGTRFGADGPGFYASERLLSPRSGNFDANETSLTAAQWAGTQAIRGSYAIPWPAPRALADFYGRNAIPRGYRRTYNEVAEVTRRFIAETLYPGLAIDDDYALSCLLMYDFLGRDDFTRYWEDVDALLAHPFGRFGAVVAHFSGLKEARAELPAMKAIRHFTRENWPEDFLLRTGAYELIACGGPQGLQFLVRPRELFLLVAVVEVTRGSLAVDVLELAVDRRRVLRADSDARERVRAELAFPRMERGESFVLPLRIELRYDLDEWPLNLVADYGLAEANWDDLLALVRARGVRAIEGEGGQRDFDFPKVRMPLSVFAAPEATAITRTYIFGPSWELRAIGAGDRELPVRKLPASAWMTVAGYGVGSCPWLVTRAADGAAVEHGRVLVGAVGPEAARGETRPIPPGTREIVLAEREPELAMIRRVAFRPEGAAAFETLAAGRVLLPGETLTLPLEAEAARAGGEVLIEGWYVPLFPGFETRFDLAEAEAALARR